LANLFVRHFTSGRARFTPAVTRCLEQYTWPGNVRELRNAMERATLLSRGELILPEHLTARVRQGALESKGEQPIEATPANRLEDIERQAILQTLREQNFNRTEAAKALGISRRALLYKLHRFRELGFETGPSLNEPDA
jgi:transcriptional regulator with PAS, ATPase and Fis domain